MSESIKVPVYVVRKEDRWYSGGVVEHAELPAMPWRRSDAETAERVAQKAGMVP